MGLVDKSARWVPTVSIRGKVLRGSPVVAPLELFRGDSSGDTARRDMGWKPMSYALEIPSWNSDGPRSGASRVRAMR
jgi:hypothetical protein